MSLSLHLAGAVSAKFNPLALKRSTRPSSRKALVVAETKTFGLDDAKEAVSKDGYVIVDLREPAQFERSHIKGAVHVPLFIPNEDLDPGTILSRVVHTAFVGTLYGQTFTKRNPDFFYEFKKKFPTTEEKLLLVCQQGLISAAAADELENYGYKNLAITNGLIYTPPGLFEKEGSRELKDAGAGGFAAVQRQFSIILGSILITAIILLQLFPDQSQEFLKGFYQ